MIAAVPLPCSGCLSENDRFVRPAPAQRVPGVLSASFANSSGRLCGAVCYRFRYRSCRPELGFLSERVLNVHAAIAFSCGLLRPRSSPSGQTDNFVNSRSSVQPRPPAHPFRATRCGGLLVSDVDVDVDAVEQRATDAFLVARDDRRGTGAALLRISAVAAWARIHRPNKNEVGRKGDRAACSADRYKLGFHAIRQLQYEYFRSSFGISFLFVVLSWWLKYSSLGINKTQLVPTAMLRLTA
jgi:hypothetical protein